MAIAEVSIVPLGTKTPSVSQYVARAVKALEQQKGIEYQMTPMGTVIEGDLDRILVVARKMHEEVLVVWHSITSWLRLRASRHSLPDHGTKGAELVQFIVISCASTAALLAIPATARWLLSFDPIEDLFEGKEEPRELDVSWKVDEVFKETLGEMSIEREEQLRDDTPVDDTFEKSDVEEEEAKEQFDEFIFHEAFEKLAPGRFTNEACARIMIRMDKYRPIKKAPNVHCPVLLQICDNDEPVPTSVIEEAARKMGKYSEVKHYPIGHFDIYIGDDFERSVNDQLDFLKKHLH